MLKRKQEKVEEQNFNGHGKIWFRGQMIRKESFVSIYLVTLKKPKFHLTKFPTLMAVKSAEVSNSGLLRKEKVILDNLQGCPFICQCFGEEITIGESGGMVYNLLLEYGSGGSLAGLIEKTGGKGLSESDVRHYTRDILMGLNYIHEYGYVCRDLKPENILLVPSTTRYIAKIGDLGVAKRAKQRKGRKYNGHLRGSLKYLAPEVVIDDIQVPGSDIWALGCIVGEMLSGKSPWGGKKDSEIEDILCCIEEGHGCPEIPSEVSKEGKDFLRNCLAMEAVDRLSADMLLNHPFVAGLEDEGDGEVEEMQEGSAARSDSPLPYPRDKIRSCSFLEWDFIPLEDEDSLENSEAEVGSPPSYNEVDDKLIPSFPNDSGFTPELQKGVQAREVDSLSLFYEADDEISSSLYLEGAEYINFQVAEKVTTADAKRRKRNTSSVGSDDDQYSETLTSVSPRTTRHQQQHLPKFSIPCYDCPGNIGERFPIIFSRYLVFNCVY